MDCTRSGKKMLNFIDRLLLSFRRDFAPVTRQFFAPSLYILYAADFNYLIRWVIVTYILLDINVVNSHATRRTTRQCSISDSAVKTAPKLPSPCSL